MSDETHPRGISQGYRAEYHSLALILIDDNDDEAGGPLGGGNGREMGEKYLDTLRHTSTSPSLKAVPR